MSNEIVTAEEILQTAREAIAEHPERLNPVVDHTCVYTAPSDPDWHCIAGEIAVRRGWKLPGPDDYPFVGVTELSATYNWPVDDEGIAVLKDLQGKADYATYGGDSWSHIQVPE